MLGSRVQPQLVCLLLRPKVWLIQRWILLYIGGHYLNKHFITQMLAAP